jgi:hypothetical protein
MLEGWETGTYIIQAIALLMFFGGSYFLVTGIWQWMKKYYFPLLDELYNEIQKTRQKNET